MYKIIIFLFIFQTTCFASYENNKKVFPWLSRSIYHTVRHEKKIHRYKMPVKFILAVIDQESYGDAKCTGPDVVTKYQGLYIATSAVGIMQLIPEIHYPDKPKTDLLNPDLNIHLGLKYLNWCYLHSKGNYRETLRCYNSGSQSHYYNEKYIKAIIFLAKL